MDLIILCSSIYRHESTGEVKRSKDLVQDILNDQRCLKQNLSDRKKLEFSSLNQAVDVFEHVESTFNLDLREVNDLILPALRRLSKITNNRIRFDLNSSVVIRLYSTAVLVINYNLTSKIEENLFSVLSDVQIPVDHIKYVQVRNIIEILINKISKVIYQIYRNKYAHTKLPAFSHLYVSRTSIFKGDFADSAYWHTLWSEKLTNSKNAIIIQSGPVKYCMAWGNSTIYGDVPSRTIRTFVLIKENLQVIYVCLYSLNQKISTKFNIIMKDNAVLSCIISEIDEMIKSVFFFEAEINELKIKYQGSNSEIFQGYMNVWDMQFLLESVKTRNKSMQTILDNEIRNSNKRNQKIIRTILLSIGLVEVLEAAIEMIDLGHSKFFLKSPEGYGIISLLNACNPNYLLTTMLLIIIIFSYIGISLGVIDKGE